MVQICSFLCLLFLHNVTLLIAVLQSDVLLCAEHALVFKHSLCYSQHLPPLLNTSQLHLQSLQHSGLKPG